MYGNEGFSVFGELQCYVVSIQKSLRCVCGCGGGERRLLNSLRSVRLTQSSVHSGDSRRMVFIWGLDGYRSP